MIKKEYYDYNRFLKDTKSIMVKVQKYNPDSIVAVARGGVTFGHFLANGLGLNFLFTINSIHYNDTKKLDSFCISNIPDLTNFKRVLIVDDIVDSGETMQEILKILKNKYPTIDFKIATLFYKKEAIIKADFTINEAKNWIEFFWEV